MTLRTGRAINPRTLRRTRGFTLIEILLVVVIMGIATLVALPNFARSAQSARLRSAVRTVSTAARLARNKAVLQQKDMAVIFYIDRNEVEIVSLGTPVGATDQEMFLEGRGDRLVEGLLDRDEAAELAEEEEVLPGIQSELVRPLPQDVWLESVEAADGFVEERGLEGTFWVNFYRNGMSDGFTVRLLDKNERRAVVEVDPVSGRVTVSYDEI